MKINVVVAKESPYLEDGTIGKEKEFYYVTTLPGVKRNPYKIRRYYIRRWLIENRFRDMTQQLKLDTVAGHSLNAILARIAIMLMMFNAERIVSMKFPGPWEEAMKLLKRHSAKGLVDGAGVIIYAPGNKFGLYTPREYRALVQAGERHKFKERIAEAVKAGRTLEEFSKEFT